MTNKYKYYSSLVLTIIIISLPSICFSKSVAVQGEYCGIYLGDMKNKKELVDFRNKVKIVSIQNSIPYHLIDVNPYLVPDDCVSQIISNYVENVTVVSHTENGRKICDKVKIIIDPEVIKEYLSQYNYISKFNYTPYWFTDIDHVLTKKSDKINIGLIIETKIPMLDVSKREQLENEEEKEFFDMTEGKKDKYRVIDRRHLKTILEEQKLSMTGLTDTDTVKLGKLSNLDIIVLRMIYQNSKVTKVLKVDTGEALLFKTYETEKKIEEGWTYYEVDHYYDKKSITKISTNIFQVWGKSKHTNVEKNNIIQLRKDCKLSVDGWDKMDYMVSLSEVDCVNRTSKIIRLLEYNRESEILDDFDNSDPVVTKILPGSIGVSLLEQICK